VAQGSVPVTDHGHPLARMTGRDPRQSHRAATPLELLFDLAFVVAFGQASDQLAHQVAEGHVGSSLLGFVFVIGGTVWAWVNFTWFASAYDTDDWFYRLTTMVQMIGVVVYALGIPAFFASLEGEEYIDNRVLLAGYVVMRVAMVAQWLRAAAQDPGRRRTALGYAFFVGTAQLAWVVITVLRLPAVPFIVISLLLFVYEFMGPRLAERKSTGGTPWHPHHIAERYGLFAIIALGEGVFGTVAAVAGLVDAQGWSGEAVIIVVAGIGLTFGLWWTYFILPPGDVLARYRERANLWGNGHLVVYGGIVGTGAGLHLAAYVVEGHSEVGTVGAVALVAASVFAFLIGIFGVYLYLVRLLDRFHVGVFAAAVVLLVLAVVLAMQGVSMGWCLIVITLAPAVVVVGYEVIGHRTQVDFLDRVLR
jgi:low temperature requirement protein LtrA